MNLKDVESVRSKLALNNQGTPSIIVRCQELQAQKQLEESQQKLREVRGKIIPLIENEFSDPSSTLVKSLSPEEKERLQFVVSFTKGNPIITQMNLKDVESVRSKLALNNQGTPSIIARCQELQAQKQSQNSVQLTYNELLILLQNLREKYPQTIDEKIMSFYQALDNFDEKTIVSRKNELISIAMKVLDKQKSSNDGILELQKAIEKIKVRFFRLDQKLDILIKIGSSSDILACIQEGANINLLYEDATPLITAIKLQKLEIVRLLIQNGAMIDQVDSDGNTPVAIANLIKNDITMDQGKNKNIMDLLLENGAKSTEASTEIPVNSEKGCIQLLNATINNVTSLL